MTTKTLNQNLAKLLNRLETTKIPTFTGQLRDVNSEDGVRMCPLGHLVDIWIEQTPGAYWTEGDPSQYFDPTEGNSAGFPSDEMLKEFGLNDGAAYRIYRRNDQKGETPAQVAQFIREELV